MSETANLKFNLGQVRVVSTDNRKGNPRVYLEIFGVRVLYSDPWALLGHDWFKHHVREPEGGFTFTGRPPYAGDVDAESLTDFFRIRVAHLVLKLLQESMPELAEAWTEDTDREIYHAPPRIEVVDENL